MSCISFIRDSEFSTFLIKTERHISYVEKHGGMIFSSRWLGNSTYFEPGIGAWANEELVAAAAWGMPVTRNCNWIVPPFEVESV